MAFNRLIDVRFLKIFVLLTHLVSVSDAYFNPSWVFTCAVTSVERVVLM